MDDLRKVLTVIILALFCFSLMVVFYFNVPEHWDSQNIFVRSVAVAMLYYLFFILLRTLFLLSLAFVEFLFQRRMPMVKEFPLCTIIVPAYNEGAVIVNAIKSLLKIDYPNFEILIVDDGSTDNTFENVIGLEEESKVRVIYKPNSGKSEALNFGIEQAKGDYYVCVDADSVLSSNLLLDSIPFFEADSNLAAVAGAVNVGNARNLLTLFQKLEYIIGLNFHKKAQSCLKMVTIVPGPIGVFKKSAVLSVGGYKSDTFAEDCELSMSLLMNGYNIRYTEKISATTEAPDTFHALITQRYRWSRGMLQSIFKSFKALQTNWSLRGFVVVMYMIIETVFIPLINFSFAILTIEFALLYETTELMGPFFLSLIIMDLSLCLYSIIMEKQMSKLFILSILNRLTYGLSLEFIRFLAIIDELFGIPMKWGVLKRKGMDS